MRHLNKIQKLICLKWQHRQLKLMLVVYAMATNSLISLYMIFEILNPLYYFVLVMQHKNIFKRYF